MFSLSSPGGPGPGPMDGDGRLGRYACLTVKFTSPFVAICYDFRGLWFSFGAPFADTHSAAPEGMPARTTDTDTGSGPDPIVNATTER